MQVPFVIFLSAAPFCSGSQQTFMKYLESVFHQMLFLMQLGLQPAALGLQDYTDHWATAALRVMQVPWWSDLQQKAPSACASCVLFNLFDKS